MQPIPPNSMIQNRYLVVQLIGQGAASDVYLAVDQRLGSAVAIKRVFYRGDVNRLAEFEREANVLRQLNHPVLPKVIDHFTENDGLFLVVEHISGDDLGERVESAAKPFPLSWVMFWADQALDTLHYLHSHAPPIIHGDIKPRNLKLTSDNHLILLDCGISPETPDPAATVQSGDDDEHTLHYAAPEQQQGHSIDGRADIYSLASSIYYLLTATHPPGAAARAAAAASGSADPLRSLTEVNREVPRAISDVIMQAMSLTLQQRFETAIEMQRTLRRAFNKKSSEAQPVGSTAPTPTEAVTAVMSDLDAGDEGSISMSATLQMDQVPTEAVLRQSEVKTEVFSTPQADADIAEKIESVQAAERPSSTSPPLSSPGYQSQVTQVARPKKSSSRAGLVIGVLAGLMFLAAVVAGGGWYAYMTYYSAATPAETPVVPVSTPTPAPTEPAVAIVDDTDQNSNSAATDLTDPFGDNSNRKPAVQATPETAVTRPTPRVTTQTTPRTSQRPTPRPTPKAPPRDDRTVILQ